MQRADEAGEKIFDNRIQINQLRLADRIFWSSLFLLNFKLPFIQERFDDAPKTDRPCKAEIRFYGATDYGLVDVRSMGQLWGVESEKKRWQEGALARVQREVDSAPTGVREREREVALAGVRERESAVSDNWHCGDGKTHQNKSKDK